jgi:hypothetical protein
MTRSRLDSHQINRVQANILILHVLAYIGHMIVNQQANNNTACGTGLVASVPLSGSLAACGRQLSGGHMAGTKRGRVGGTPGHAYTYQTPLSRENYKRAFRYCTNLHTLEETWER